MPEDDTSSFSVVEVSHFIAIGTGLIDSRPGSVKGLQVVIEDADAVRAELISRGVEVSDVQDFSWGRVASLSDPDGNCWSVQEPPRQE